jgi:molecular chaperone GrpE
MSKHHSHGQNREKPGEGEAVEGRPASPAAFEGGHSGGDSAGAPAESPAETSPVQEQGGEKIPARNKGEGNAEDGAAGNPEERIAELEARLAEAGDQFLRKAADFENFRKRMNREKQDAIDFANQSLLLDLIPIIDDFERALKSSETSRDFNSLYEGIGMIEKRLSSQLESKWGLRRFDSEGEPFDPNRHEALMMEKSAEITEPKVVEDFLKGYTLKDRVVRSAKVKVLMPENSGREETAKNAEGEKGPEE